MFKIGDRVRMTGEAQRLCSVADAFGIVEDTRYPDAYPVKVGGLWWGVAAWEFVLPPVTREEVEKLQSELAEAKQREANFRSLSLFARSRIAAAVGELFRAPPPDGGLWPTMSFTPDGLVRELCRLLGVTKE